MSEEREPTKVPVWLVVLVLLAFIPASTLAMTVGVLLGSGGGERVGSGTVHCDGVKAGRYAQFFEDLLVGIKAPVSDAHITALAAWHQAEGGHATWNPLNTTQPAKGATDYNSVGVKNYPSERVGVHATVVTLTNGNYPAIITALRANVVDVHTLASTVDGSVWGTKHMSNVVQGCTLVRNAGDFQANGGPNFANGTPWGGFRNGEIPERGPDMAQLPASMSGGWLRWDAAQGLVQLDSAFKKRFGHDISVTEGYRTLAEQRRLFATKPPGVAAQPGTSMHGWGCAVDLGSGINHSGSPQFTWMKHHAAQYGWVHPYWAEHNPFEPWHWEFQRCTGAKAA